MRKAALRRHADDVIDYLPVSSLRAARTRRLERLLRRHQFDTADYGRMVGVIGDHISDKIRIFGRYEFDELEALDAFVLSRLPGRTRCCVDVGANIGNHCLYFSRRFDRVHAFEPNPLAVDLLRWNLRANGIGNVRVHTVGLAEQPSTATMSIVERNLGSSHLGAQPDAAPSSNERVQISLARGDDLLLDEDVIDLVKIDVEGFELNVLRGLRRTLERHQPIVLAEALSSTIDTTTGTTAVADLLTELGYVPFEMLWRRRSRLKWLDALLTAVFGTRIRMLRRIRRFEHRSYPMVVFVPKNDVPLLRQNTVMVARSGDRDSVNRP
jgi:FkbM family methyltransferase